MYLYTIDISYSCTAQRLRWLNFRWEGMDLSKTFRENSWEHRGEREIEKSVHETLNKASDSPSLENLCLSLMKASGQVKDTCSLIFQNYSFEKILPGGTGQKLLTINLGLVDLPIPPFLHLLHCKFVKV